MSINELVDDFCRSLRRRHVEGSLATGKRTAELLRILITSQRHSDAQSLLDDVRRIGVKIQSAKPLGGLVNGQQCHVACMQRFHARSRPHMLRADGINQPMRTFNIFIPIAVIWTGLSCSPSLCTGFHMHRFMLAW